MAASTDYILPEAAWCSEFTNLVQLQERVQYFKAALKCTFKLFLSDLLFHQEFIILRRREYRTAVVPSTKCVRKVMHRT